MEEWRWSIKYVRQTHTRRSYVNANPSVRVPVWDCDSRVGILVKNEHQNKKISHTKIVQSRVDMSTKGVSTIFGSVPTSPWGDGIDNVWTSPRQISTEWIWNLFLHTFDALCFHSSKSHCVEGVNRLTFDYHYYIRIQVRKSVFLHDSGDESPPPSTPRMPCLPFTGINVVPFHVPSFMCWIQINSKSSESFGEYP